jgi:hypothetical protein
MLTRRHTKGDAPSRAVYSDCETYRYSLTRVWEPEGQRLTYVMLNPSRATEVDNDPTVERCERRARTLGYGGFCVVNIFALRETDPKRMRRAPDPVGPDNDAIVIQAVGWADHVIAAWGTHGAHKGRGPEVAESLRKLDTPLFHLGLSKDGHPKHPLYIAYTQQPILWSA